MKKIILKQPEDQVWLDSVHIDTPIFAKKHDKICGMLIEDDVGWILKLGGSRGATGHHSTRTKCIESVINASSAYTFHIM